MLLYIFLLPYVFTVILWYSFIHNLKKFCIMHLHYFYILKKTYFAYIESYSLLC